MACGGSRSSRTQTPARLRRLLPRMVFAFVLIRFFEQRGSMAVRSGFVPARSPGRVRRGKRAHRAGPDPGPRAGGNVVVVRRRSHGPPSGDGRCDRRVVGVRRREIKLSDLILTRRIARPARACGIGRRSVARSSALSSDRWFTGAARAADRRSRKAIQPDRPITADDITRSPRQRTTSSMRAAPGSTHESLADVGSARMASSPMDNTRLIGRRAEAHSREHRPGCALLRRGGQRIGGAAEIRAVRSRS